MKKIDHECYVTLDVLKAVGCYASVFLTRYFYLVATIRKGETAAKWQEQNRM